MSGRKYHLREEERELIIRKYDGRKETIDEIERELGFHYPRWFIKRMASDLGLTRQKEPRWSEEEEAWLERNLPKKNWQALAAHLRRSVTAVKLKAKHLRLTKTCDGNLTAGGAAAILGCDSKKVVRWIERNLLPAKRYATDRTEAQGGQPYRISPNDLRKFVIKFPMEIDLRRVDPHSFIDLLTGGLGPGRLTKKEEAVSSVGDETPDEENGVALRTTAPY
ncbi:MAG TPA: hypothetical protein VFA47_09970 [Candidatus Manganitrophaceae bacterium]|nr:hypothetical protein [Candidatus Manganitrophaceae bacterium]